VANFADPEVEKEWTAEAAFMEVAFPAAQAPTYCSRFQSFPVGLDLVAFVFGGAAPLTKDDGSSTMSALVTSSILVDRGLLQGLVNILANNYNIRAVE